MEDGLKELGPTGVFISMMATAVAGLSAAVAMQWRHANKVYGYRLAERDTLNKALTDNATANTALAHSIAERNKATTELSAAVNALTLSNKLLHERLLVTMDALVKDNDSMANVVRALSESIRTQSGIITEARNSAQQAAGNVAELKALMYSRQ